MQERSYTSPPPYVAVSAETDDVAPRRVMRAGAPAHAELSVIEHAGRAAVLKSYAHAGWVFRMLAGALLIRREAAAYAALDGVAGVPRLLGRVGRTALVVEHIDGRNCVAYEAAELDSAFFDRLADLLGAVRARGVLHGDVKRNVVRGVDGGPWLVDFGASFVVGGWLAPLRPLVVRCAARYDGRAVAKLKRQVAPQLLTADDQRLLAAALPFERIVKYGERILRWGTQWIMRRESRRSGTSD